MAGTAKYEVRKTVFEELTRIWNVLTGDSDRGWEGLTVLSYFGRRLHLRRGLGVGILAKQSDFRARTKFLLGSNDLKENRMMVMNNRKKQDFIS